MAMMISEPAYCPMTVVLEIHYKNVILLLNSKDLAVVFSSMMMKMMIILMNCLERTLQENMVLIQ